MIRLKTFGSVDLEAPADRDCRPLLAQPKRLALLVYLAAAHPVGARRRDELLALFWPDLDDARARDALNQALHFLRQVLGGDAFQKRGAEEVALDPEKVWCDAGAFRDCLTRGEGGQALGFYRGDFLQGFFIEEAGGFEAWLEGERRELRELAARGSREVAERHEADGNLTQAVVWGKRALELTPDDERALRRLMRWYDRAGDRAGAFRAYEAFAKRFAEEFGAPLSAETKALVERLQTGKPLEDAPGVPAPAAPPVAESSTAERYRIEGKLGEGGMATVYRAWDLRHDREVALKVLKPQVAQSLARERFIREIRIAGRLQHPNIVPLFDSGEMDGQLYYVMPLVQGPTLRDRLRTGPLPIDEVVHLLRELTSALGYAHAQGVIHRDIKPGNILLIDRRAVLADFGIARAAQAARAPAGTDHDTLTQTGVSLGTPAYMAPEQVAGGQEVDHRADLYALGAVAYEMLTGRPPFADGRLEQVLAAQLAEPPRQVAELREETPAWLASLVMWCLEKGAANRPASAEELGKALQSATTRPRRRRSPALTRQRAGTVVALLALLLVAAIWRPWEGGGSTTEPFSRLAVLYFDDGSDGKLGGLARGLTEDLIDALASVSGLTVISRNGVRPYEGRAVSPQTVGRELKVGLLVDGTVGSVGAGSDSIALSVRLVDASSGIQLDRQSITRPVGEQAKMRRDLTSLIGMSLRRKIGNHTRLRRELAAAGSDDAWQLLRRGRELREESSVLEWYAASRLLDAADSLLAEAERTGDWVDPILERASLALVRLVNVSESPANTTAKSARAIARIGEEGINHATRAVARAPRDPRGFMYRGDLRLRLWMFGPRNASQSLLINARHDLLRATAIDPGLARAWYVLSEIHRSLGEVAEADLAARKALSLDVYASEAPGVLLGLMLVAIADSSFTGADSLCSLGRLHFQNHPSFKECPFTIVGSLGADRQAAAAADSMLRALDRDPELHPLKVYRHLLFSALLARAGLRDSARRVMRQYLAEARDQGLTVGLELYEAHTELMLGNGARAVSLLGTLVEADTTLRPVVATNPWFRRLRSNPQFRSLVRQGASGPES